MNHLSGEEEAALSDFEEKLNAILSNPEAMAQVMGLAQSLSGSGAFGGGQEQREPESKTQRHFLTAGLAARTAVQQRLWSCIAQ